MFHFQKLSIFYYYYGIFQTPHSRICSSLRRVKPSRQSLFLTWWWFVLMIVSLYVSPDLPSFVCSVFSSVVLPLLVPSVPLSFPPLSFRGSPYSVDISIVDFYSHPILFYFPCAFVLSLLLRSNPRTVRFTVGLQSQSSTSKLLDDDVISSSLAAVSFSVFSFSVIFFFSSM